MSRSRLAGLFVLLAAGVVAFVFAIGRGPIRSEEAPPPITVAADEAARETPIIEAAEVAVARAPSAAVAVAQDASSGTPPASTTPIRIPGYVRTVKGRVLWPDGRPAIACTVHFEVRMPGANAERGWILIETSGSDVTCKPDGSFEITVSADRTIDLTARTTSPPGFAHRSDVHPDDTGIELVLEAGRTATGRAVDDRGDPIGKFTVTARALEEPKDRLSTPGEAGQFALGGLHDGTWEISAEADGHSRSSPHRLALPADTEAVDLLLPRCASVRGKVLLPTGEIASNARVRAIRTTAGDVDFTDDDYAPNSPDGARTRSRTDTGGEFVFESLDAGPQRIVASSKELADSEPAPVDLRPGDTVHDLVLRLQRGGSLVGEVLDPAGKPLPGRGVSVVSATTRFARDLETDEAGEFRADALAAGRYRLMTMPTAEEIEEARRSGNSGALYTMTYDRTAVADIVDGETTHVTIGGGVPGGIRVHGVVTMGGRGGNPLPNGSLTFQREGEDPPIRTSRTDDRGQYEVVVDREGGYVVGVSPSDRQDSPAFAVFIDRVRIPSTKDFAYDIALPSGSIAGRIVRADGSAAAGFRLLLEPEASTADLSSSASVAYRQSDESGAFLFDGLIAGTYRISTEPFPTADPWKAGKAVKPNLQLAEGQHIEGIELRLQATARIEGTVSGPDGKPFPGAVIFVRDEAGALVVRTYPPPSSDPSGRFVLEGLTPGDVTVGARTEHLVAAETPLVKLRPGETSSVALALRAGTVLRVIVQESSGTPVGAALRVIDDRGQQVGAAYPFGRDEEGEPFSPESGVRIGPIPPGRYRITAMNHDRTSTSREISVSGDEQLVTLKFGT